jgi:uroporphyrinogen-III synthase
MGLPALIEARLGGRRGGRARATRAEREETLLYLAGADITRELTGALGDRGYSLITHTTYRMVPVKGLPAPARDAFAADRLRAILHYSRRSAQAFIAAARGEGVEISALALPQCCLSDAVAQVMRDAGAARVVVARAPDDASMIEAVLRATQT